MASVTIKDIARRAGVSIATVSYVVNESRAVSPESSARVLDAIKQLGYSPNAVARSLRRQRTSTIGLIVPDNSNPFFAEIAKGVEDAGFEAGYSVILCNSNAMHERELAYLYLLQSKRVDGIIFMPTTAHLEQIRPVVEHNIPVVVFYRESHNLNVDTVRIDNFQSSYMATRYLVALGHQDIACIRPASSETPSARRVDGFKRALENSGLAWHDELMPQGNNRIDGGREAAQSLLQTGRPFTAVFACNDAMAIGAIRAFRESGRRVPEDVSVLGFDDILLASYSEPPLTTVAQPKYEAGRRAVEFLVERIEGENEQGPRDIVLETKLVVRGSCAPIRTQTRKRRS